MVNDPIGDMITRLRNAVKRRYSVVELPHSQEKEALAKLLVDAGYLSAVKNFKESHEPGKMLRLDIVYNGAEPSITTIRRLSKPGCRVYSGYKDFPRRFRGILVISTSRGLMTGAEAYKRRLGGELVCEVY